MILLEVRGVEEEGRDGLLGYTYELEIREESIYREYNVLSPDNGTYDFIAASLLMGGVM